MNVDEIKRESLFSHDDPASIQEVIKYAESHRFTKADLYAILAGARTCPGDDPHLACHLTNGLRMAFSFEEHPMGWCRHLSISDSNRPLDLVGPDITAAVAKEFGFKFEDLQTDCTVWFEDAWLPTMGPVKAVNVLQKESL